MQFPIKATGPPQFSRMKQRRGTVTTDSRIVQTNVDSAHGQRWGIARVIVVFKFGCHGHGASTWPCEDVMVFLILTATSKLRDRATKRRAEDG